MSEEFQGGVCGGSWWNSSTNLFRSSTCSSAINGTETFYGRPSTHHDLEMDMKKISTTTTTKSSSDDSEGSNSVVLQDEAKMMGTINLSSSTITNHNWNQEFLVDSGRSEENYSHLLHEATALNSGMNYGQQNGFDCTQINKEWSSNNYGQQTGLDCLPLISASFSYNSVPQSLLDNNQAMNSYSGTINYNQMINSNEFLISSSLPKASSPMINKPSLQFTNNTAFWNATDEGLINYVRTQPQFVPSSINNTKSSLPNFTAKRPNEEKKDKNEPALKRPRIETPSPLPTFKVRKEKMGDRITALQQLVSPFGKTDTASVLHEAIEYIKFLHDQVLSSPYMKNGSPPLQSDIKDQEGLKAPDLKSRGLCLVPVSSTFPVTSETSTDFWTPTFGGSFR